MEDNSHVARACDRVGYLRSTHLGGNCLFVLVQHLSCNWNWWIMKNQCVFFHSNPKMRHLNKVELAPIRFLEDKVVKSEVDPSTIGISNLHLGSLLFFLKIHYWHYCVAGRLWMFKKVKATLPHCSEAFKESESENSLSPPLRSHCSGN